MASVCVRRLVSGKHGPTDRLRAGIARGNLESGTFFSYGTKNVRLVCEIALEGTLVHFLTFGCKSLTPASVCRHLVYSLRNPRYALSEPTPVDSSH